MPRKKSLISDSMEDAEEHDITSADDDLGSAGGSQYGDQGEEGPYFDEENEDNTEAHYWDDEDQGEAGLDEEEEVSSGDDNDSGSDSGGSSDGSDDESEKPAATNNRPKKKRNDTSVRPTLAFQENITKAKNTAAVNTSTDEQKSTMNTATKESVTPSIFLRQRKRTSTSNLTKEEALVHTRKKMEASQQEQLERVERKRLMGIPLDTTITTSDDATMNTPPKARSRLRSPGNTPGNETKMQRTSTAPSPPTTQDEIARTLDYASNADESHVTEPTGNRRRRGEQEK
jgi:hypothetical protein